MLKLFSKTALVFSMLILLASLGSSVVTIYSQPTPVLFSAQITRPWPSQSPIPSPTTIAQKQTIVKPKPAVQAAQTSNISESSFFDALAVYRQAHSRTNIVKEESLCVYARKRATEHLERLKNLTEGESTLDNHAGFQRDAENGSVFAETGFSNIAEVLAFLPQAQTPTQVIEWGWDSSTTHREGLLSNQYTHACITGNHPFYVGILGSR